MREIIIAVYSVGALFLLAMGLQAGLQLWDARQRRRQSEEAARNWERASAALAEKRKEKA